jgi:hypothetical protein
VTKFIALMSVVAFRLYFVTLANRALPEESCELILKEHEWQALCVSANRKIPLVPPTVREAVRMIAKLGGFLGRKSDGEPGTTVVWRGWDKLQTVAQFFLSMQPTTPLQERCG